MTCTRCKGFMVIDDLIDLQESLLPMWMRGWRCVACGNVVDPLIQRHRLSQQPNAKRSARTKTRQPVFAAATRGRLGMAA